MDRKKKAAGITQTDITRLMHAFYADVRKDDLLSPIFATRIADTHWDEHMAHIGQFWSSIFLKTGAFSGNPMRKHLGLTGLTPAHFERWLELFSDAGRRVMPAEKAEHFDAMAQRIARSFQMGLALHHNKLGTEPNPFRDYALIFPE